MNKVTTVVLSLMLVLIIGQATFASANIGATVGYSGLNNSTSGLNIGVSGDVFFNDSFGLGADLTGIIIKDNSNIFNVDVMAKLNVFSWDKASIGLQAGIIDSISTDYNNLFAIAAGAYFNATLGTKFNIYADAKIPVFTAYKDSDNAGFFKVFLYDLEVGATYDITPNIYLGVQASIDNINHYAFHTEKAVNNTSIGVKLGCKF